MRDFAIVSLGLFALRLNRDFAILGSGFYVLKLQVGHHDLKLGIIGAEAARGASRS